MNLARQHEMKFGSNAVDLDEIAVQKEDNYATETTAWIFEDRSALTLSGNSVDIIDDFDGCDFFEEE